MRCFLLGATHHCPEAQNTGKQEDTGGGQAEGRRRAGGGQAEGRRRAGSL